MSLGLRGVLRGKEGGLGHVACAFWKEGSAVSYQTMGVCTAILPFRFNFFLFCELNCVEASFN
jgi:hypothetical protein